MEQNKKIILFDGVCNLCNTVVQFVIKRDTTDSFRFAALQSDIGIQLTSERGIDTSKVDSIVLIDPKVAYYIKADAALEIGKALKGYRTLSRLLSVLPKGLKDIVYDFVARNRYRWYGKQEACMVPTPELQGKFLG